MTTTSVDCMHCGRTCGSLAGLSAHMRSMHADKVGNHPAGEPPPAASTNGHGELVWEDPPPPRSQASAAIQAVLTAAPQLRRNPGKWAKLRTFKSPSGASSAKNTTKKQLSLTDIEFVARAVPGGSALYGRYVEAE